ncbi:IS1380 family transposase [Micromonospora sp. NBC_01638]|uniref:IS1380 family transposase n=1 Tax=Micromonospora sp. NBC_01638 TaxID=2975982 RepID=UPI003864755D|nr:IS1380 family transposase [Micromonospora sp. NBC_01638]WTD60247.1 IS1380 family transposase [Micromonospora sp. NBC_01638]WTD60318.1 IS1380 family transposase [Micromonospora sp. NBC_01638]
MKATATRPKITVTGDGRGVVGHAGARLIADLADATGLTSAFSQALAGLRQRQRQRGHDPGRIAVDLAVVLADGGEAIADLAVLRDQAALFGPIASDPTAWRLLSQLDATMLAELRAARAHAREIAWAQHADTRGDLPQPTVAGQPVDGLVLDIDATIVICHSDKESATRTWKKTFGFHPLLCFLDNTGEALAGLLREGRAGSNTTTDHITVLDQALAQIPDAQRHGTPILLRADSAGSSHGFLAHIRSLREHHLDIRFSVGAAITEPVRAAIRAATGWVPAVDTSGDLREHAEVCEITGLFDAAGWPEGTRFLVRRERPHPGAQLSLFDTIEGWRHQVVATDTPPGTGSIQHLEARHRAHARVEDRIRTGKNTGFGRFPSRIFAINQAWLQLALTGIDLLAWTQALLLDGDLATAEPKKLRYRLLHVAARITRTARRTRVAIAANWPWTDALTSAFSKLMALPRPTG